MVLEMRQRDISSMSSCSEWVRGAPRFPQLLQGSWSIIDKASEWKGGHTSINTNKRTVLGPKRMNAGVHPLNKNLGPSFRRDSLRISNTPSSPDCAETLSNPFGERRHSEYSRAPLPAILPHQQGRRQLEESINHDRTRVKGHELVATVPAAQLATACSTKLSRNWYSIHGTGMPSNECLK